jgi:hypothetical protein
MTRRESEGMLLNAGSEDLVWRECNGNTTGICHRWHEGRGREGGFLLVLRHEVHRKEEWKYGCGDVGELGM